MRLIPLLALMLTLLNAQSSREALLIGNYKYSSLTNLDNPSNNLKRLKSSLEDVDFRVKTKINLNDSELEDAIEKFKKRLSKDRDTIGFLYYTGHGCQVNYQGYLLPTNVNSADKLKVKYNAMNINRMLETLTQAGNRINLLFLDACRDVPTGSRGGTKGLGQPTATAKGSLVVYATEAGKVANDNAKFINALIENINRPNQYLRDIADNISNSVAEQTSYAQIPEVFAKLLPKVVLKGGGGGYVPPTPQPNNPNIVKIGDLMYQNQPFSSQDKSNYDNNKNGGRVLDWQGAKGYCQDLTLGGYKWRLPNINELKKLLTKTKHKNSKGFEYNIREEFVENMPPLTGKYKYASFWSSTEEDSSFAWSVNFGNGNDRWNRRTDTDYVLCVSGQ